MRNDRDLLEDMLKAIRMVAEYTPADRDTFNNDLPLQSHLVRYIQIVGEASWRLSDSVKSSHPEIPWRRIAAMRHVLVHDYFRIDLDQVWNVATVHIPVLGPQIEAILQAMP